MSGKKICFCLRPQQDPLKRLPSWHEALGAVIQTEGQPLGAFFSRGVCHSYKGKKKKERERERHKQSSCQCRRRGSELKSVGLLLDSLSSSPGQQCSVME